MTAGCNCPGHYPLDNGVVYDPVANTWTSVIPDADGGPPVPQGGGENAGGALLADGRVLVAGGQYDTIDTGSAALVFYPTSRTWASAGNMTQPRESFGISVLPSGKVLVSGGTWISAGNQGTVSGWSELFDPSLVP